MSNLLSQASLVMIPSGYKEDVVYSQIPTDGSGDMSFTRASNGTRVNSSGLVEVCPWNLLQQSNTFGTSPWAMNVTSGQAGKDGQNNAWLLTKTTATASDYYTSNVYDGDQTFTIYVKKESGKGFKLYPIGTTTAYTEVNLQTGAVFFSTAGITSTTVEAYSSTWWKISVALNMINSNYYIYVTDGAGTQIASSITIQDAQVNIGFTAKPYFPTTDRLNVPRLTYQNGGGGCPSLLLEKQSTNLLLYSQQFDQWATSGTTTANVAISPDGTQNADRLNYTSGNVYWLDAGVNVTNGVSYTYSLYVKPTSVGDQFRFYVDGGFNVSQTITTDSSDWKRYEWTFTATATASINPHILLGYGMTSQSILVWGAQLEASSYPTSYIPTTSSSATRVADACYKTGISSLFGTNQGTFFIDFVYLNSVNPDYLFDVTDSSNTNRFLMYALNDTGLYVLYDTAVGGFATYQLTNGQRYKIAVKYNSTATYWYINGVFIGTGGAFGYQMSQIYLGQRYSFSDQSQIQVNETIVFPTALSGTELISLTTI